MKEMYRLFMLSSITSSSARGDDDDDWKREEEERLTGSLVADAVQMIIVNSCWYFSVSFVR